MAHDSWNLKQKDFSSREIYRDDPRRSFITRRYADDEFHEHEDPSFSPSNDYSHFRSRTHSSRSGSDVRYINPAIYAESLPPEESAPRSIIKASCGDSGALVDRLSSLSISESSNTHDQPLDHQNGRSTYRCRPLISPPTPSTFISSRDHNSKSSVRVLSCTIGKPNNVEESSDHSEEPEVQRYDLNGTRIVEFSSTSCSNISGRGGSTDRFIQAKKRAHEEWVERKRAEEIRRKEELRKIEQEKQVEEDRLAKEREERERENFLQWTERKRREEASKREAMERELDFERRLKEVEGKAVFAKTIYLRQWARKKEEQQRALQKKQEMRKKRDDEERKKRLEESERAYVKWRETSKNRPRPATQGLLPHQKATPSYVNPNPWIADIDEYGDTTKNQSGEMTKTCEARNSVRKSISSKQ